VKELYQEAEQEIILLEDVDIITTSTQMDDDELPPLEFG
jgi:hypothetical protein